MGTVNRAEARKGSVCQRLCVKARTFPKRVFPNGDVYFKERLCGPWAEACCAVVMVHNNWIYDFDGQTKISRLQALGTVKQKENVNFLFLVC